MKRRFISFMLTVLLLMSILNVNTLSVKAESNPYLGTKWITDFIEIDGHKYYEEDTIEDLFGPEPVTISKDMFMVVFDDTELTYNYYSNIDGFSGDGEYTIENATFIDSGLLWISEGNFRLDAPCPWQLKPYIDTPVTSEEDDSAYYAPLSEEIENAVTNGSTETIEWSVGDSLPKEIVEQIINNPGINVHFTYSYEGVDYDLVLNSSNLSAIYQEDIPWYGPQCLSACNNPGTGNVYIVLLNDTLGAIAVKFNTTVDALLALNPDITNPNMIFEGQRINY